MSFHQDFCPALTSATLIDNLYINSNVADRAIRLFLNTDSSDHLPLFMLINSYNPVRTRCNLSLTSRKLDNNIICGLKNKLGEADWEFLSNLNCEEGFEAFQQYMREYKTQRNTKQAMLGEITFGGKSNMILRDRT